MVYCFIYWVCSVQYIYISCYVCVYAYAHIDTSIICIIPSNINQQLGNTYIQISNNEQDYSISDIYYLTLDHINIINMIPTSGPISGGTHINITTQDLSYIPTLSLLTCKIDQNISIPIIIHQQYIICQAPQHNIGTIYIQLSMNNQNYQYDDTSSTSTSLPPSIQQYEYRNHVQVIYISPPLGPIHGMTNIIINATNIQNSSYISGLLKCKFGTSHSYIVSGIYINDNQLLCQAPSYAIPELLSIEVSDNGQDYSNNNQTYQYILDTDYQPYFIYPNAGVIEGGKLPPTPYTPTPLHPSTPL